MLVAGCPGRVRIMVTRIGCLGEFRDELLAASAVVVFGDGDTGGVVSVAGLRERSVPVYFVSGLRDDKFIVESVAENAVIIDGRLVRIVDGLYLAGVGGREPIMNITSLKEKLAGVRGCIVLASYFPVKGVLDSSRLGVGLGLYELADFLEDVKPCALVSSLYNPGSVWRGGMCFASVGRGCCAAALEYEDIMVCRVSCRRLGRVS